MCRGKDSGNRRCPHDTAEARKRRRRAAQARKLYDLPVELDSKKHNALIAGQTFRPFKELKKEAQLLTALLHTPVHPDPVIQAEIDAKNEILVTRLGQQLGLEAERRSGVDIKQFNEKYQNFPPEFYSSVIAFGQANRAEQQAKADLDTALADNTVAPAEIDRLQKDYAEKNEAYVQATAAWNEQENIDRERRDKLTAEATGKITAAYKSVIADIRPVGGTIDSHELSSADAVATMQETVGKDYPSTWIQASKDKGPVAIISDTERPHYNSYKTFPGADGLETSPTFTNAYLHQSRVAEFVEKLSEGDPDSVLVPGERIDIEGQDEDYRFIQFPNRIRFDPTRYRSDDEGKPEGPGWKYGYVLEDNTPEPELTKEKVWYRTTAVRTPVMRGISITPASNPDSASHAYHEAVHSFEDSVGDGHMMSRLQKAFLNRRTSIDGKPSKLRNIIPTTNLPEMEFVREGGFMHIYIGREYHNTTVHKEVLSVGAEALFAGKMGSFMRLDGSYREDLDHRSFTLGMFASA